MTKSGRKRGYSPEQSTGKETDHPLSCVSGDISVSPGAGLMPHLACVDDTFSKDLLASPQISDQEELLFIGEEPPSEACCQTKEMPIMSHGPMMRKH